MTTTKNNKLNWIVPLIILAVLLIYSIIVRNKLVGADEGVKNQWGNLQGSYQRRMDLIPQLVSTVKAVGDYEKNTLTEVASARATVGNIISNGPTTENFENQEKAQSNLVIATNKAIAIIEKYPDLQTNKNYLLLQEQLSGTERRVAYSRRDFSASVKDYNLLARNFPSSIVAKIFGFNIKEGFKADDGADKAPQISFSK